MKVIIVGKGAGWEDAPQEGEVWGVNDLCARRDVSLVFQMHDFNGGEIPGVEYVNRTDTPMVCLKKWGDVPTSIRFPLEEMHTDYFTNSISYMVAYAIHEGATSIDIYGCGPGKEHTYQKPNLEYWVGYARGKGVTVNIHEPTTLMKAPDGLLYGYLTPQSKT